MLEDDIRKQQIDVSREDGLPVFFQSDERLDVTFDVFAAIFYLLSRYEEYLPHETDEHGRFKSADSVLSDKAFNFSPVVEIWLQAFKNKLLQFLPGLPFKVYQFEIQPTFDIDNAFKYKGRNWLKHPPNIFRNECRQVLSGQQNDPYDTVDFILDQIRIFQVHPVFFFLLNDDGGRNSMVAPDSKLLHRKIQRISQVGYAAQIGIHFSYDARDQHSLQTEIKHLAEIINTGETGPVVSRRHFLRIRFPHYFRAVQEAGIQKDYSLAYPDVLGFRAGYSREFYFYDLVKNHPTTLLIQPSCYMDATYEYYRPQEINVMEQETLNFLFEIKKINCRLVPIFHNDLLGRDIYRGVFLSILQQQKVGV